jgi:large-conductance mechanosensitive channel
LPFNKASAQGASVKAFTNERKIVIGDQVHLFLEVKPNAKSDKIQWAAMPDSIHGLEIVEKGKIDTVVDGNSYSLKQRLLVTGFDSGKYYIPSFHFQITANGQVSQYATDSLPIEVQTVAVDTAKAFKPIKGIQDVKFSIWDYWKELLAALLLIAFIAFLVIYFIKNKNTKIPEKELKAPPEKAHEKALRLLSELKEKQYMQQGKGKEYFTEMSDIVRTYLEERFGITAMEQTTDELLSLLKKQTDSKAELRKIRPELKLILRTADLAKFAKANPLPDEYEASYAAALEVIRRTQFKEEEAGQ